MLMTSRFGWRDFGTKIGVASVRTRLGHHRHHLFFGGDAKYISTCASRSDVKYSLYMLLYVAYSLCIHMFNGAVVRIIEAHRL